MTTRLLAAVNRKITSSSSVISAKDFTTRKSFDLQPMTEEELKDICRAAGVGWFKFRTTVDSVATCISQEYKWRATSIVLVDMLTIKSTREDNTCIREPVQSFDKIRNDKLPQGQAPRTIIGMIPHKNVPQSERDEFIFAGVDMVCTPEELKTVIPEILAA